MRLVRAAVLAAHAVLLGGAAHVHGGGASPGLWTLLLLVASGTVLTAPLLRERAGLLVVVTLLVAGQSGVHLALMVAEPMGAHADHGGAAMLLGHALAAALCGLWLAWGERAAWELAGLAGGWVGGLLLAPALRALVVLEQGVLRPLRPDAARDRAAYLLGDAQACLRWVSRRGPPALA